MAFCSFSGSSTRVWSLLALGGVAVYALQAGQGLGRVEQSIAGIRVGDSIKSAKRLFPGLSATRGEGVWTVPIGRNCKLEVVALDAEGPQAGIDVITLERVRPHDLQKDPVCDSVRTGAGLRFGADFEAVQRVYKGIALMEQDKEPALYREENGSECLSGRSPVLRSMFVYWSQTSRRIQTFSVDASRLACEEIRDAEKEHQQ